MSASTSADATETFLFPNAVSSPAAATAAATVAQAAEAQSFKRRVYCISKHPSSCCFGISSSRLLCFQLIKSTALL
ncbi:hypothetical protein LINGRAPRIM_LOCUS3305 [Linum grandiflorum]